MGEDERWLVGMSMHETESGSEKAMAPVGTLNIAPGIPLVIDSGARRTRGGFAGEGAPRVEFLTVLTRLKGSTMSREWAIGEEGRHLDVIKKVVKRPNLAEEDVEVIWPLDRGIEPRWDELEVIWRSMFYDHLGVDPEEHPFLISEPPICPQKQRESICNFVVKSFKCPRLFMASEPVMALFSTQRTDGLVVQVGKSWSFAVPVYHGCFLPFATVGSQVAGVDVTRHLESLFKEGGHECETSCQEAEVVHIKETQCYLKIDLAPEEEENDKVYEHTWCSGEVIKLKKELFQAPEVLFHPALCGSVARGVQEITAEAVLTVDLEMQNDLLTHIVITGGTAATPNFSKRLSRELQAKGAQLPQKHRWQVPKVQHLPDGAWLGGSMFANMLHETEGDIWVTREDYEEFGCSVVQRKCF